MLRRRCDVEVVGLLTTFNEAVDRVAMHAVRHELVERQATAAELPLDSVPLPHPCSNAEYEQRMRSALGRAHTRGLTHVAFGDLFLEDVRDYRIALLDGTGLEPLFPIWCSQAETPPLARRMIDAGLRAVVTCVDPAQVPADLAGRQWDDGLLAELPASADPCGERGEFHTFCWAGPMFDREIGVEAGESLTRDGFRFADLTPTSA